METIFTNIYEKSIWGNNNNTDYLGSSGSGSDVQYNKHYIQFLKHLITNNEIKSVVDLGCGDFRIGKLLYDDLNVVYTGYDAYKNVIEYNKKQHSLPKYTFAHLDFYTYKENIQNGDLCILKDVIQHWSLNEIYSFLDYLTESKKFKYILLINCCNQRVNDTNCTTGDFRHLSCNYLPLKKYNPFKIGNYNTKEISIITLK